MLMENILKKSILQKIENRFFYLLLIIVLFVSALNMMAHINFTNSSIDEIINGEECDNFIYSFSKTVNVDEIEIDISNKDIYIFPEYANILCLGKVSITNLENGELYAVAFTNTKFINFLLFIINFSLIVFKYFLEFPNEKFKTIFILFNLFIFINYFHSLNLISVNFTFIPMLTFYFLKNANYED